MGIYSEYLDSAWTPDKLQAERKAQLGRISTIRGRDVLVYAADLDKSTAPTSLDYSDLAPVQDQLSNLSGTRIDVILETPGGSAEVAEDIVRLLHGKYDEVAFIIPGWAKSAGTIMTMAGDEILMEPASALGPIDAQLIHQGKRFSADALLEGVEKIKDEVTKSGTLSRVYVPILQGISPGELQSAENALKFARVLVADWLATYKFKNWATHSSTGNPVTDADRTARAEEVAEKLCDHRAWLTHGRSIKIADLEAMRLRITDYSQTPDLCDAVRRYHTLLRMAFGANAYKIIETPASQIVRVAVTQGSATPGLAASPGGMANVNVPCGKCKTVQRVQANLDTMQPLAPGSVAWPDGDKLACSKCGYQTKVDDARKQVEAKTGKKVVTS